MNAPADSVTGSLPVDPESAAEELIRQFGVGPGAARRLADAGYGSVERVRDLSADALLRLGLDRADVDRIIHSTAPDSPSQASDTGAADPWTSDPDRLSQRLMSSVRAHERGRRKRAGAPAKGSLDAVKKWVAGDDRALETWIRSAGGEGPPVEAPSDGGAAALPGAVPTMPADAAAAPALAPDLLERERTVVRWLTELLDRMKSDQFDPATVLQDVQDLQRALHDERGNVTKLEAEIEHVKRGSVAVIKYVRGREAKLREQAVQEKEAEIAELKLRLLQSPGAETAPTSPAPPEAWAEQEAKLREEFEERETSYVEREAELRRRVIQLEGELREIRVEAQAAQDRRTLTTEKPEAVSEVLEGRLKEVEGREKELSVRENDLRTKFEEIRIRASDIERQLEPIRFKQNELKQWEHQLQTTKAALEIEARRVEQLKQEELTGGKGDELRRLSHLKTELAHREEDLRLREDRLRARLVEADKQLAQAEADVIHEEAASAAKASLVPTGVRRLDDLLFGGVPPGSQVLVNGPAHSGKETLARLFVAEGLRRGIPALWVVTDKTYVQIREEMAGVLPSYPQMEARGMVRYVDLYSRSLGVSQSEPGVRLFQSTDKGVLDQLTQAVNAYGQELRAIAPSYRLVFESVSTVTAYLDTASTFRFFQPFAGRRKLDGAVSYYILETGMHSESDMETLEHMVDGSLNLKVEQLKTFLSVRGITDVQSRAWVGYTFTKRSFNLGSFSLDHIR